MEPQIEALAIRMLTEYNFDENQPPEKDVAALENYKRIVQLACDYPFSKRGIDFYNSSLADDERFESVAATKKFIEHMCAQVREWAKKR